ncbi:unnamed protein product [Adineta ricciae]|uniref:Sequestosome-1 n=1 Tax=Adineta ricciae TaxID=249248 RepID=A0A814LM11_ADIRI|nr:unnamed protein product [Adineta ricciae]CAF1629542.1 unnamed protein product [Adineta ricciae]
MMASPYFVKVYFTKQQQQQQPEIRRFAIDISPENNIYQELCTKIATLQPDIQLHGFTLQYIDDESERITFSSTEELRSAISTNKDTNALKIFVTANQPAATTSNKEQHVGVDCDGCDGPIFGVRYKCVICSNYDLCENCSSTGLHSEHNMIKISKPTNLYHPYGFRQHHRRHRFSHPTPTPPTPPFTPNSSFFEQIQAQIPQWLPNREHAAHLRTHMQHHFDNIKTQTQTQMQHSRHYLENVGQYIQQALSPLGIDCDFRVDGQPPSTSGNSGQSEASTASGTSSATETNQEQNGISSMLNMFRSSTTVNPTSTSTEPSNLPEKNIEECVEKLKAMGFDEVDETLIELIREKQGDLNSVLDEMSTRRQ